MEPTLASLAQEIERCMRFEREPLRRRLATLERRLALGQHIAHEFSGLAAALREATDRRARRVRDKPVPTFPDDLPVAARRHEIAEAIREHQVVVICGETGSGKTTQLPKICLELGRGVDGMIGHTQPRRIAARTLAQRIASELQTPVGRAVGYKVRFDEKVSAETYVKLLTDGMLLAETQNDRLLEQYDTLIVDEAHERSLNIDFILGYLLRLLPERPDLKVIVTSATIDPQRFSRHFAGAPVLEVSGRTYPVEVRYRPPKVSDPESLEQDDEEGIVAAIDELSRGDQGDILVFLPTERAIRETAERLEKENLRHTEVLPLYARLSSSEQGRIFAPHGGRRIVLATNVAETSLTVPGIKYVIDSGLARMSRYDARKSLQRLPIERVSQASARQRAGRCGRTSAGVCIRLYSAEDFADRSEFTAPEIVRTNLTAVILQMEALGLGGIEEFPFLEPPDRRAIRDGYETLVELGAIDREYRLTPVGKKLARLPVDPRIARMVVAGSDLGCLREVLIIAAALSVQDVRERPADLRERADAAHRRFAGESSDFASFLLLFRAYRERALRSSTAKLRAFCAENFLSFTRMREWVDIHGQLEESVKELGLAPNDAPSDDSAVHRAILTGLLRHLAIKSEDGTYLAARNIRLNIFPGSVLYKKKPNWIMVAEIVETDRVYGRIAAKVEPEWIEPLAEHLLGRSYFEPHWDETRGQVVGFERVTLFGLTVVAKRKIDYGRVDPETAREILIRSGLVEGGLATRAEFRRHNQAVIEGVKLLAHKARRHDLEVDSESVYAFFDARVPADVFSASSFERWRKRAEEADPRLLHLGVHDVVPEDLSAISDACYPPEIVVGQQPIAVRYRFEPGHPEDGVTAVVPLAAVHRLPLAPFEWLVPGLLTDKIAGLLDSLPKAQRRTLVPVRDVAIECRGAMNVAEGSLREALCEALAQTGRAKIDANAFRLELLPEHFNMRFEVVDASGRVISASRDLAALQGQLVQRARAAFATISKADIERANVTQWNMGTIPAHVDIEYAQGTLPGYPALVPEGDKVALRVFDARALAEVAHRRGLCRLYRLRLADVCNPVARSLPGVQKLTLQYALLGDAGELRETLVLMAIDAACVGTADLPRTEAEFERGAREGRGAIAASAERLAQQIGTILEAYHRARKRLGPGKLGAEEAGIQAHLDRLVHAGFLAHTPHPVLPSLARYIRAVELRLERLRQDPPRQRERAAQMGQLFSQYERRLKDHAERGEIDSALESYRWLLEEFHISLFAQELRSGETVSVKRLTEAWGRVRA